MKTKYPRTYHFPFSPGATSDDRISKEYGFLENTPIVITEKLDGQNNSITSMGVFARSHGAISELPWDKAIWDIHVRIKDNLDDDSFIFGENMYAIHSLEYRNLEAYFYVFAIRVKDEWLSWDEVCEWSYILDLPTVPLLFSGVLIDIKGKVLELVEQPSALDARDIETDKPMMEGLVCRIQNSFNIHSFPQSILKWVRENHVKSDAHWTKNWKRQPLKWEYR